MSNSLTKRSILLSLSTFIDIILKLIAAVFVTKIITANLGESLYGAWTMITQILGYLALTSLNTSTTLKIRLAAIQHLNDDKVKQMMVSAATKLYEFTIILTIIATLITIYFSKYVFYENTESITEINIVLVIGVIGLIVEQFGSLYSNALRGNNLDYRGIGIRSFAFIVFNIATVIILYLDGGIIGLAFATLLGKFLITLSWRILTKRILEWYKVIRVTKMVLIKFFRQSLLTLVYSLGNIFLVSSDAILIGIVLGSKYAGFYFISTTLVRSAILPVISTLVSSSGVGLSNLINTRNDKRVVSVTKEILQIATVLIGAGGVFYILLNQNIVSNWVGSGFYSNENIEVIFLILVVIQFSNSLIQYLIDGLQLFKEKAKVSLISGTIFIPLALILLNYFNLNGLLYAALICSLISTFSYLSILKNRGNFFLDIKKMILGWLVLALLFITSSYLIKPFIPILGLKELILWMISLAILLGVVSYLLLPNSFKERLLINNPFNRKRL